MRSSDEGRDYISRMRNASARMQNLINDLLTFSRVTSKAQPFQLIDLKKIAEEVASDLEIRIEQTGGRVEIGDLPEIDADALQMRQLFQNLIGNALKFHRADENPVIKIYSKNYRADRRKFFYRRRTDSHATAKIRARSSSRTTASALKKNISTGFLPFSSVFTGAANTKVRASVWRFAAKSSNVTADKSRLRASPEKVRHFS